MTTFDRRVEAFEQKFVYDEALQFRAIARRNRKLGDWAARQMNLDGAQADAYALSFADLDLTKPGAEEVPEKIRSDLTRRGVTPSEAEIRRLMEEFLHEAIDELQR